MQLGCAVPLVQYDYAPGGDDVALAGVVPLEADSGELGASAAGALQGRARAALHEHVGKVVLAQQVGREPDVMNLVADDLVPPAPVLRKATAG